MDLKYAAHYELGRFVTFNQTFADGFLGSQSSEEFWEISQEQGCKTIEDAVKYFLKEMQYTPEDLSTDLDYAENDEEEQTRIWGEFIACFVSEIENDIPSSVDLAHKASNDISMNEEKTVVYFNISFESLESKKKFDKKFDETRMDMWMTELIQGKYPGINFGNLRWEETIDEMRGIFASDAIYDIIPNLRDELLREMLVEATIIYADIRQPAGNAQARVYIPKNAQKPLGQLVTGKQYKIIFLPIH